MTDSELAGSPVPTFLSAHLSQPYHWLALKSSDAVLSCEPGTGCREMAESRLAGITQELREQERVLTERFDASEASWSSLHSTLQVIFVPCWYLQPHLLQSCT